MKVTIKLIIFLILPILVSAQTDIPSDMIGEYHFHFGGRLTTLIISQDETGLKAMVAKGPTFKISRVGTDLKFVPVDTESKYLFEFYQNDEKWECKMTIDAKEYIGKKVDP